MKILKWLAILFLGLVLVVGIGIVSLVYLVDWNDQKERIQSLVKTHTGRDLEIAGDLSPSVFPWAGISVGGITLSNAPGFGDAPFARIGSADVKVELLPLLRRTVNIRTVTLAGMELDLQRAADGTTNWDDLVDGSTTTTSTTSTEEGPDGETEVITTEVEGSTATIAALSVGGIDISDANVHWRDAQADMDATLSGFDLQTGAIALNAPFELTTDFGVSSTAMDVSAEVESTAEVTLDLERQTYTLNGFTLDTTATGGALPGGEMSASLGANVVAALGEQRVVIDALVLQALGTTLGGEFTITDLNTAPQVTGRLAGDDIDPGALFDTLGIERPVTADPSVLSSASLALSLAASPRSVAIDELVVTLDEATLTGSLGVPTLAATVPPLRFDMALDAIDVDRYLPPVVEGEEGDAPTEPVEPAPDAPAGGDVPIELPEEMMRQLDVDGTLRIGSLIVSGLSTTDIVVPVKAAGGKAGVEGMSATLYEGVLDASAGVDVSGDTPVYSVNSTLEGIQAEPLLGDLTGEDSFLSGAGRFQTDIVTRGDTVDALSAALNGGFGTAFTDGSINGINIGYQLRRARAALSGQSLSADEASVKTDFSSLQVSGQFTDGVMSSDDLDMRSPLLRLNGAGTVDLPGEAVDYVLTLLITGTAEGQGGQDLEALKGVELDIPIRGTFAALAEDPAGVMLDGLKAGFAGNLNALTGGRTDELKAEAEAQLKAKEDELRQQLQERQGELEQKLDEQLDGQVPEDVKNQLKDGLRGLLDR